MDGTACVVRDRKDFEKTMNMTKHVSPYLDFMYFQGGPGTDSQVVCGMCGLLYDMSYPLGVGLFMS